MKELVAKTRLVERNGRWASFLIFPIFQLLINLSCNGGEFMAVPWKDIDIYVLLLPFFFALPDFSVLS